MKILKYLVFILIGLTLLFLAVGFIHPVVPYGHEITVNKPIKEAWGVLHDVKKYDQWLEGFKSIDLVSGEKGTVGSTYKVIVNPGDDQPEFEMLETIESMKEFDHVSLNFDSDMMIFDQTTSLSETDGKTTIKTDSKVAGKGMMMRSMFALMEHLTGSFTAQETKNIEALKKLIETNTTDYYPAAIVSDSTTVFEVNTANE